MRLLIHLIFFISLQFVSPYWCIAQQTFQNVWVGTDAMIERANFGRETSDGGYILVGHTSSFGVGEHDVFLTKTDEFGSLEWAFTFGGLEVDRGQCVQQTSDSGFIIAGSSSSFTLDSCVAFLCPDIYLIKTDVSGDTIWTRSYGVLGGNMASAGVFVLQTSNEDYIIVGTVANSVAALKVNSSGNLLWARSYNIGNTCWPEEIKPTSDGGFIIAGTAQSGSPITNGALLIRIDGNGNLLWGKTYNGLSHDRGLSVEETLDGGFILLGHTQSFGAGGYDVFLLKTSSDGEAIWAKTYGSLADESAASLQQTSDSDIVVLSFSSTPSLMKTNSTGDIIWSRTYSDSVSSFSGNSLEQTSDDGYILFGMSSARISFIKIDSNGSIGCSKDTSDLFTISYPTFVVDSGLTVDTPTFVVKNTSTSVTSFTWTDSLSCFSCPSPNAGFSFQDSVLSISFVSTSSITNTWLWNFGDGNTDTVQNPVHTYSIEGTYNVCLTATNICGSDIICDSISITNVGISERANQSSQVRAYPNPFNSETTIEFKMAETKHLQLVIYDISGERVKTLYDDEAQADKLYRVEFDATSLSGGIYFYRLFAGNQAHTGKLVVIKQ